MQSIRVISSFLFWSLLQILLLNHLFVFGYLNPYAYIAFILLLPARSPRSGVLSLAFLMGLLLDMVENSGGVHIAASVFIAFIRRPLLRFATQKSGPDFEALIVEKLPLTNMALYALISIFIHHFLLFLIEDFSFSDIGTVLLRTATSSIFTFAIVLMIWLWNYRKKE